MTSYNSDQVVRNSSSILIHGLQMLCVQQDSLLRQMLWGREGHLFRLLGLDHQVLHLFLVTHPHNRQGIRQPLEEGTHLLVIRVR